MSIRLSPTHGLNCSLGVCWWCLEDNGTIYLPGLMRGDKAAPRRAVWDKTPCDKCAAHMKEGVFLFEAHEPRGREEPERTGRMVVIKDDAVRRIFSPPELVADILKKRCSYVDAETWRLLGLPT